MNYVILGLLAVALIYSLAQMKKGTTWAKPAVIVIAVVTIITALINMILQTRETAYRPDYRLYEIIGQELAKTFGKYLPSGGTVIIFTPYDVDATSVNPRHSYYMEGFGSGFSSKNISIGKVISLPQMGLAEMNPEEYGKQLQEFYNDKLAENEGIAGWITLGSLPAKLRELDVFSMTNPAKVALIGGMSSEVGRLIKDGFIQTVIAGTPEVHVVKKGEKIPPETLFQTRYMVVTPDNLAQIIERWGIH